jgi:nitrogen fixation protein
MFFRRDRPKIPTFAERIDLLRNAGFTTEQEPDGRVRIVKRGIGAIVGDEGKNEPMIDNAGVLVGGQIATLLAGGYQEFLEMPNGRRLPATADQLRNLHEFEEDVKEALGVMSLYNTSLGTTSRKHVYDRLYKRDLGQQPKPWEGKDHRFAPPNTKGSL